MRHWFMRGRLHIESFVCVCHTYIYICIRLIADKHLACDAGLCISALGFVEETTSRARATFRSFSIRPFLAHVLPEACRPVPEARDVPLCGT